MAVNRLVPRDEEPVEFRPVPGQEHEWAGYGYFVRSKLWDYLGLYPALACVVGVLTLIGLGI